LLKILKLAAKKKKKAPSSPPHTPFVRAQKVRPRVQETMTTKAPEGITIHI
jgi:hypothetical protein